MRNHSHMHSYTNTSGQCKSHVQIANLQFIGSWSIESVETGNGSKSARPFPLLGLGSIGMRLPIPIMLSQATSCQELRQRKARTWGAISALARDEPERGLCLRRYQEYVVEGREYWTLYTMCKSHMPRIQTLTNKTCGSITQVLDVPTSHRKEEHYSTKQSVTQNEWSGRIYQKNHKNNLDSSH